MHLTVRRHIARWKPIIDTTVWMTDSEVEANYGHNSTDDREDVEASYGHNSTNDRERGGSQLWTQ